MESTNQALPNNSREKLIGWLVSYGLDADGRAFEIRAGRSLVSFGNAGEKRTIGISDRSISSPHLALNATHRHKLLVQDIFSEHGSYLTKSSGKEETPIQGPIEVEHGDWLRIGSNIRLQVCIIDDPSR